ncbi:MAG: formate dehydrogenase subunit gamma [Acidobacteria bacterium]|nr:MAG: formate dehydrogenase subunit gamma [Acidobacteriota bacterium]
MSATASRPSADPAILRARRAEDVVVGEEIVRHRLATRVIHWTVALFFFLALFSGLPIWTPLFGWMAHLLGGLNVCRWLHPWAGALFFASMAVMFVHWLGEMRLEPRDREWLRPQKVAAYMKHQDDGTEGGKYNGGQKLFFFAAALGAVGLLLSGLVMWFPLEFPRMLRELAILLHDVTFILFVLAVVFHIYLGTAAEPGTFHSMIRGTVTKPWARLHHPRWHREVLGEETRRP